MRSLALVLVIALAGCSADRADETSTTTPTTAVPDTTSTTSTTAPPRPCPPAPYRLDHLPATVQPAESSDSLGDPDEFTSIGGTHVRIWVDVDGNTAIALVRGSLPPVDWPAEKGEVSIAGSRGVAGPHPDGKWVVGWFNEPGERCDQYTMVFYPPISPDEVESTLAAMERTPG